MSDCKHEPIEEALYVSDTWGSLGGDIIGPKSRQPSDPEPERWLAALVFGQDPRGSKYAMMGCRHCKAMFVDIVPPLRKVEESTDPHRSDGGAR